VENLYVAMGQPVVTNETFWTIYCDLLKQLCDGSDKVLSEILTLLQDMNPFRLGQPLNVARNGNYIGRLDLLTLPSDVPVPCPEYANFTSNDETDNFED
jgi:hypothetical protein